MLALLFAFDLAAATPAAPPPLQFEQPHICDGPGGVDLDGDGVDDHFDTVSDSCGTGGCTYTVHLAKDPGRSLGEVNVCWMKLGAEKHHGLYDLVATWRGGCCSHPETRYRFDGRRYRALRRHGTR